MDAEEGHICADHQAGGDHHQLVAALYREHAEGLRNLLLGLLRDRADADEALQQVFLRLLESWQAVEDATAKGWLYTVAYHEAMARRRRQQVDGAALERLRARPAWQAAAEAADPAREFLLADRRNAVRQAVRELPDGQREVVQRRMYRDQTFAAIADELGCPLNTVLSRMRLAVEKLKRLLEEPK